MAVPVTPLPNATSLAVKFTFADAPWGSRVIDSAKPRTIELSRLRVAWCALLALTTMPCSLIAEPPRLIRDTLWAFRIAPLLDPSTSIPSVVPNDGVANRSESSIDPDALSTDTGVPPPIVARWMYVPVDGYVS